MRTHLWIVIASLALAGTACKQDEPVDQRADEARDRINTQRADYRRDVVEVEADVKDRWAATRAELGERLARLDARIQELEARADEESKQLAEKLREQSHLLAARLDSTGDRADSGWEDFKADVSRSFDDVEKELDEAFR